ncbi:hypothetical protein [Pseudosulfitobacter pseudonitzschiae]|uniref:hypothetical protein n=1 Tax=Pseudosulfitobacter pseudonitzschiae TaxID=1402135 RepID=UPI003B7F3FE7
MNEETLKGKESDHQAVNLPSRKETFAMMVVTGIYLLFEVAFGARLLDVVGSTTDVHEIEQIETAGRFISGIALTLVVWTAFVLPRIRKMNVMTGYRGFKATMMLTLSCTMCCILSYVIQEEILETISEKSSAAQRQAASTLTLVSSSVQNSTAVLKGIDFDEVDRNSPEMKTFMALLPSLALSIDRLEERTRSSIEDLLRAQAVDAIGNPERFYTETYFPSMNALKSVYNDVYFEASEHHSKILSEIPDEQKRLYREYRNSLGRYTPTSLPRGRHGRVRADLRSRGIPVSIDWELTDRAGFYSAVDAGIRSEVTPAYEQAMEEALGFVPPDNLGQISFFSHPQIQEFWRDGMGMSFDIPMGLDLDQDAATATIYKPWLKSIVDERRPLYFSPVEDFEVGGKFHDEGVTAIRIAYIPLIAFGFSLLGALVHSFKTMNFAFQCVVGLRTGAGYRLAKVGKILIASCVVLAALIISVIENPVTRSELFAELEAQTKRGMGAPASMAMRTVIQLQPYAYPVAEWIRRDILFGITYDFDPDTEMPAFESIKSVL